MNVSLRREVSYACVLIWILGIVGSSNARPSATNNDEQQSVSSDSTAVTDGNVPASFVVPQVGFLEERTTTTADYNDNAAKDASPAHPNGNSGSGILVPIVSVIGDDSPKSGADSPLAVNGNNPLVALLPAPSVIGQGPESNHLPIITTLPVLPYDQGQSLKPEVNGQVAN